MANPFADLIPKKAGAGPLPPKRYDVDVPPGTPEITVTPASTQRPMDFAGRFDPQAYDRSSFVDPVMQGLTFGFSDEIMGGVGGVAAMIGGKPFSEGYTKVRDRTRASLEAYRAEKPVTAAVAEMAGALATIPVAGPLNLVRAPAAIPQAAGLAARAANALARGGARVANSAATGAAYGGAYGVGTAEDGLAERAGGGIRGAGMGAALGVAAPAAGGLLRLAGKGAKAPFLALRGAKNVNREASRRVVGAIERDTKGRPQAAVRALQAAQRDGVPMIVADTGSATGGGGTTTRALARSAANASPEARDVLTTIVSERFGSQAGRAIEVIRSLIRTHANAYKSRQMLEDAARKSRKPFYDRAYKDGAGGVLTPRLIAMLDAPPMQVAIKQALKTAATKEATGRFTPRPAGSDPQAPTIEFWDYVKRALDDQIGEAQRRGAKSLAADLSDLKNRMVSELDLAVPSYATARGVAATLFKATDALEAGEQFVSSQMSNQAGRAAFNKLTVEEQDLFREGFVSRLIDNIQRSKDRTNILGQIAASPQARERLEIVLGKAGAEKLRAHLHVENIMDMTRTALQGNSTTVRQLMEIGLAGTGGFALGGGNVFDPKSWMYALIGAGSRKGLYLVDQRVQQRVGEMLASQDPKVLQEAIDMIARNPRTLDMLVKIEGMLLRAALPVAANQSPDGTVPDGVDENGNPERPDYNGQ